SGASRTPTPPPPFSPPVICRKQTPPPTHGKKGAAHPPRPPGRPQPQPHPRHQIDDREEYRRHLIWRRIGIEPGGKRRPDSTNDRPMIDPLAKRNDGHHSQEHHQPVGPLLAVGFAVRGVNRLEDLRPFGVGHGSSRSLASGAKCRSTSDPPTAPTVDGRQPRALS